MVSHHFSIHHSGLSSQSTLLWLGLGVVQFFVDQPHTSSQSAGSACVGSHPPSTMVDRMLVRVGSFGSRVEVRRMPDVDQSVRTPIKVNRGVPA